MSIEINPPISLHSQLHSLPEALSKSTHGDVVGQMNVAITKMPSGEHSNRLHSQIPAITKTESMQSLGNTLAANSMRTTGVAGQSAVTNLNLLSTVMSALHVTATNTSRRMDNISNKTYKEHDAVFHRPDRDKLSDSKDDENSEEEDTSNVNSAIETPEDHIELVSLNNKDIIFKAIVSALAKGEQFNIIRQLENKRRIIAVFPDEGYSNEIKCDACAYMLWIDSDGFHKIANFLAQIVWADLTKKNNDNWVSACGYKDRATHNRWFLKMQSSYSQEHSVSFQIGSLVLLPGTWKGVYVNIPDAFRFWLKLDNQFSLQTAISRRPLVLVGIDNE